jgi:beta-lactamase regulating signal transducer with metallopeptidase domain
MFDTLSNLLTHEAGADALAVLLDSGAKGLALLALAAGGAFALRRASAASRHLVWILAMAGLLLLPALSVVVPKWQLPLLPSTLGIRPTPSLLRTMPEVPWTENTTPVPSPLSSLEAKPETALQMSPPEAEAASASVQPSALSASPAPPRFPVAFWTLAAWGTVAGAILLPLLGGLVAVGRLVRAARPFADPEWSDRLHDLSAALGVDRPVRLLCAGPGTMPMAVGLLRPAILLPQEADTWPEEKRRAVLLHELAHVARRDCLTHALARVALALHWFNPLAWVALRQMRVERERACDDRVLTAGERASAYADHLLDIARTMHTDALTSIAAITMAKQSQLEGRLLAVLDPKRNRKSLKRSGVFLGVLFTWFLLLPLAAATLTRASKTRAANEWKQEEVTEDAIRPEEAKLLYLGWLTDHVQQYRYFENVDKGLKLVWTPEGKIVPCPDIADNDFAHLGGGVSGSTDYFNRYRSLVVMLQIPGKPGKAGTPEKQREMDELTDGLEATLSSSEGPFQVKFSKCRTRFEEQTASWKLVFTFENIEKTAPLPRLVKIDWSVDKTEEYQTNAEGMVLKRSRKASFATENFPLIAPDENSAPQLRMISTWTSEKQPPDSLVAWKPDGQAVDDKDERQILTNYPLSGDAAVQVPQPVALGFWVHCPFFDDHSDFNFVAYDSGHKPVESPSISKVDIPIIHKRFPGWRFQKNIIDSSKLPDRGQVEVCYSVGSWIYFPTTILPNQIGEIPGEPFVVHYIQSTGPNETEISVGVPLLKTENDRQYEAVALTDLDSTASAQLESLWCGNTKGRCWTRFTVPLEKIKGFRVRYRPIQRHLYDNVVFRRTENMTTSPSLSSSTASTQLRASMTGTKGGNMGGGSYAAEDPWGWTQTDGRMIEGEVVSFGRNEKSENFDLTLTNKSGQETIVAFRNIALYPDQPTSFTIETTPREGW